MIRRKGLCTAQTIAAAKNIGWLYARRLDARLAQIEQQKPTVQSGRRSRDNGGAPEPTPAPEPAPAEQAPAPTAIHVAGYRAPVPDAVAARRAKWAIAKRASRALAKAKVQWRGNPQLTAAAGQ